MMTPEQAVQILTLATAQLQATRQQHNEIGMAIQTLEALIPKPAPAVKLADSKPVEPKPSAKPAKT